MFIKYALLSFLFLQGEVLQHQHVVAADSDIKEDISHPGDISFVSTTESSHQNRHLGSIWIPDCSKNKHKDKPQCICRFPTNYDEEICINWRKKIETKNNVSNEPNKIVGGENAPVDKYPWFARLTYRNGSWAGCGGMLVAPEYVLTAAHCVAPNTSWSANQAAVQIGAVCPNSGNNCGQPKQQINVASITPHPQYSGSTSNNDFALVKLASRANAAPVAMDQGDFVDNYSASKRNIYAIGLGTLSSGGSTASQLRHVELAFVPRNTCNNNYFGAITGNMMCAADPNQDSCQGDSGGPLYDDDNNVLIGVVSWGYGCADPQYPGVYAQVSAKWSWIKSTICDNHSTPKPDYCSDSPTPPTPTPPTPTPPTPTGCASGELAVEIDITTDIYPQETSFSIEKSTNGLIEEAEYEFDESTEHNYDYCLDSSICHKFTIIDLYGDGILAPGGFSLTVDNVEKLSTPDPRHFLDLSVEFGDCDNNTGSSCDYEKKGKCRRDPACFWKFGECNEFLGGCEDYTKKWACKRNGCKWKKVSGKRKCVNP